MFHFLSKLEAAIFNTPRLHPRASVRSRTTRRRLTSRSKVEVQQCLPGSLAVSPSMLKRLPRQAHIRSRKEPFNDVLAVRSDTSCRTFLNGFLGLPVELRLGILCELGSCDVFSLRATCRSFHDVIVIQASPIVRHLVKTSVLAKHLGDYVGMYPLPEPTSQLNLDYLYDMSHRLQVVDKLSRHLANFIVIKILNFGHLTFLKENYVNNMMRHMKPVLLVLLHFFERYRAALVHSANKRIVGSAFGSRETIPCCEHEESEIIRKYNDPTQLWRAHNIYRLLSMVLRRKLRTPSYAGRLESTLRGWGREPATKESIVQLIVLGGFKDINDVLDSHSYGARLNTLHKYLPRVFPSAEQPLATSHCFPLLARQGASRLRRETGPVNGSVYLHVTLTVRDPQVSSSCPALYKISCSVMPRLDTRTAVEVSRFLPDHDRMWRTAAERHMVELGVIQRNEDLPHMILFLAPYVMGDGEPDVSENPGG